MPEISELQPKSAEIIVPFGEETVRVIYDPMQFNATVETKALEYLRRNEELGHQAIAERMNRAAPRANPKMLRSDFGALCLRVSEERADLNIARLDTEVYWQRWKREHGGPFVDERHEAYREILLRKQAEQRAGKR